MSRNHQAGLGFIFVALLIDVLGAGLIVPVLPQLIGSFENVDLSLAASFYGFLIALYSLLSFLFASFVGSLSDRFGRRSVLLLSLLGLGIDYVIIAVAPNLGWLVVGRALAGVFGAIETTATAYIADVSLPDKRAQNFGLVGAAFGIGFIIGPLLGSLLGNIDLRLPFWGAAALSLINVLYGLMVLPESLPTHHRKPFNWARANPVGSLLALRRLPNAFEFTVVFSLLSLALNGLVSVWVLYTSYRFGWGVTAVDISLSLVGIASAVSQGMLVRPLLARLGEKRTVLLGLIVTALAYALYGLATHGWMVYAIIALSAFGGLSTPVVQAIISRQAAPEDQGVVQGALAGLNNLANVVAQPASLLMSYQTLRRSSFLVVLCLFVQAWLS